MKMVMPGGSRLRCYSVNEVITRAIFARLNIGKKTWDVKTMKMPFPFIQSSTLTYTSIELVSENRNIQFIGLLCNAMTSD